MVTPLNVFALLFAYLLGSIPSAVWIGKMFYNTDVREHGSGNAGATNAFRVLGKKAGLPVLFIDILKGWLAVNMAYIVADITVAKSDIVELQLVFGIAALMGHIFPIWASFRGGKGIATLLGITLAVHPQAALLSVLIFALVFFATHYVSLSAISGAFAFPFGLVLLYKCNFPSLIAFGLFTSVLVLITHQKNIERLIRKQESKVYLGKKILSK
jgi:acyl phosphate:glycerol-3-phosphate acyltransferase